jgi:hypothetical protein
LAADGCCEKKPGGGAIAPAFSGLCFERDIVEEKEMAAAETAAVKAAEPYQFDLVANRELAIGDEKVPEGTVLARLELPPGAPYSVRFITRSVEDLAIIPRARE